MNPLDRMKEMAAAENHAMAQASGHHPAKRAYRPQPCARVAARRRLVAGLRADGMSLRGIAEKLSLPLGTVKSDLAYARAMEAQNADH